MTKGFKIIAAVRGASEPGVEKISGLPQIVVEYIRSFDNMTVLTR